MFYSTCIRQTTAPRSTFTLNNILNLSNNATREVFHHIVSFKSSSHLKQILWLLGRVIDSSQLNKSASIIYEIHFLGKWPLFQAITIPNSFSSVTAPECNTLLLVSIPTE